MRPKRSTAANTGLPTDKAQRETRQTPAVNTQNTPAVNTQVKSPRKHKRKQNRPLMREIKYYQTSTHRLIARQPFGRLLKEIFQLFGDFRITPQALDALQESSEMYLVQLFQDAYRCTAHRNRVTLSVIDIQLVRYLRGNNDAGNL